MATSNKSFVIKNGLSVGGASGIVDVIDQYGNWIGATGTLQGASGSTGPQGASGVTGASGVSGASGYIGHDGATGPSGASGATGSQGIQGASGATGIQGNDGATGHTGDIGATGVQGNQGATGSQGIQGASGATGTQGASGSTGLTGATGIEGASGATGYTGSTGPVGSTGPAGDKFDTTSSSTLTINSTGATGIVVGTNLNYTVAQSIILAYDYANHQHAQVISYNPVTGAMQIQRTSASGSGTYSAWEVNLDGAVGVAGATGVPGVGGTIAHYGDFYSSTAIGATGANIGRVIPIDSTRSQYGVTVANNGSGVPTRVTVPVDATYQISFSAQIVNSAAQPADARIFIKKNNVTIADSSIVVNIPSKTGSTAGQNVIARIYTIPLLAGDYFEFWANFSDTSLSLEQFPGVGATGASGAYPASPPVEVSVTQVTYTLIGASGSTGLTGATGTAGTNGTNGATGATGPSGASGIQGASGVQGASGSTGLTGATGPQGNVGASGVQGNDGATGSQGIQGASGSTGLTGQTGATGSTGPIGDTGSQGASGSTGLTGATGTAGTNGTNGATGATGPTGNTGSQGASGSTGIDGATGATGPAGTQGASGSTGINGATGSTGPILTTYQTLSANTTVGAGSAILANTAGGSFTITLPASPTTGDSLLIADAYNWTTNNLLINRNGETIENVADNLALDMQGVEVIFAYTGTTWKVYPTLGARGATGAIGASGTGPTGATGPAGINGASGTIGVNGASGASGATGPSGINGATGSTGPTGINGASGATGIQGPSGQSSSYYEYKTKISSQSGDPGSGYLIWNNSTQTSASYINISHLTNGTTSVDIDIYLALINLNDVIIIQDKTNSANYQKWQVNGSPIAHVNSYYEFPVTLLDSGGTGSSGFSADQNVIVAIISTPVDGATGPYGASGATGPSGINGASGASGATGPSGINGSTGATGLTGATGSGTLSITFVIDGGGSVITTGVKGYLTIPFACTITEWTLLADVSGSIVVDIWKDTLANYPPVAGDVITASAKPTLTTQTNARSSTLTGWTTSITAGDILAFNVNSATTVTKVTLSLAVTR